MRAITALIIVLVIIVIAYCTGYLKYVLPICFIIPLVLYNQNNPFVGGGFDNLCRINDNLYIGTDGKGTWYNMEKMTKHNKKFWYLLYSLMRIHTAGEWTLSKEHVFTIEENNEETRDLAWEKMSKVYALFDKSRGGANVGDIFKQKFGGLMAWMKFDYTKYDIWFTYITPRKINWDANTNRSDVDHHEIELVIPVKHKAGAPMTSHIGIQKSPYYSIISACAHYQWNRYIAICGLIQNVIEGLINTPSESLKDRQEYYLIYITKNIGKTTHLYNTHGYASELFEFLNEKSPKSVEKMVKNTLHLRPEKNSPELLKILLELEDDDYKFLINTPKINNGPELMKHWNDQQERLKEIEALKKSNEAQLHILKTNIDICELLLSSETVDDSLFKTSNAEYDGLMNTKNRLNSEMEIIKRECGKMKERVDDFFKDYMEDIRKNTKYNEKMKELESEGGPVSPVYLRILWSLSSQKDKIKEDTKYIELQKSYNGIWKKIYDLEDLIDQNEKKLNKNLYFLHQELKKEGINRVQKEKINGFITAIMEENIKNETFLEKSSEKKLKSAEIVGVILLWRIEKIRKELNLDFIYYPTHEQISISAHSFAAQSMLEHYKNISYMICAPVGGMRAIIRKAMEKARLLDKLYIGDVLTISEDVPNDKQVDLRIPYEPAGKVVHDFKIVYEHDVDEKGLVKVSDNPPILRTYTGTTKNIKILSKDRKDTLFEYIKEGDGAITIKVNGEKKNSNEYEWWYDPNINYVEDNHDPFITIELDALASVLKLAPCN